MPWLINHKCNLGQSELSNYALLKVTLPNGEPATHVLCDNPPCKEEFIVLGQEMFAEAHQTERNLPPGFVIARSIKS